MSFPKTPKTPALVTDCAVFDMNDRVLLVRRGSEPFKGRHALPGGFVEWGKQSKPRVRVRSRKKPVSRYQTKDFYWSVFTPSLTEILEATP